MLGNGAVQGKTKQKRSDSHNISLHFLQEDTAGHFSELQKEQKSN